MNQVQKQKTFVIEGLSEAFKICPDGCFDGLNQNGKENLRSKFESTVNNMNAMEWQEGMMTMQASNYKCKELIQDFLNRYSKNDNK